MYSFCFAYTGDNRDLHLLTHTFPARCSADLSGILLTDGLPTLGGGQEEGRLVSADERLSYFKDSLRHIPKGIPVNTLLFPMEGDPEAAGAFWELAVLTQGSFITPARDWP